MSKSLILLIDGDQEDRDYYAHRLLISSQGFVILHATTGQSGLALCQWHPVDCVVLELDLPDMSGFEVLVNLVPRVHQPDIAVIVLTRLPNQYLLGAAIKNGARAALYKPMTSGEMLDKAIAKAISTVQKDRKRLREPSMLPR